MTVDKGTRRDEIKIFFATLNSSMWRGLFRRSICEMFNSEAKDRNPVQLLTNCINTSRIDTERFVKGGRWPAKYENVYILSDFVIVNLNGCCSDCVASTVSHVLIRFDAFD